MLSVTMRTLRNSGDRGIVGMEVVVAVGGVEDIVSRELSREPEPAWRVEVFGLGLVYEGG